jgi:hypothetical protein
MGMSSFRTSKLNLQICFAVAVMFFIFLLPFLKSKKSMWDAIAARKVSYVLKVITIMELFVVLALVYYTIELSSPVTVVSNFEKYWVFGFGRPSFGIIFICLGLFAEMHSLPRALCAIGCVAQGCIDAISSVMVYDYIYQVDNFSAPLGI